MEECLLNAGGRIEDYKSFCRDLQLYASDQGMVDLCCCVHRSQTSSTLTILESASIVAIMLYVSCLLTASA